MIRTLILVGIGGGVGSILRYLTTLVAAKCFQIVFPLGTFIVNILGCLLMGIFLGILDKQIVANPDFKHLLIIGLCGGYTTFSAFASENSILFQSGNSFTAIIYMALSIFVGLFALWVGFSIIKLV